MPVIVFGSPKGGVGKTTAALLLACELANGTTVSIIDADPNRHIVNWAALPGVPPNIEVVGGKPNEVTEDTIFDVIEAASTRSVFVICDLEGVASRLVGFAVTMADFVIIPCQGSQLDASMAARMIRFIHQEERHARRPHIPYAIVLTRGNPIIMPGTLRHIEGTFTERKIPVLRTRLYDREAFRAIFSLGGTLASLEGKGVGNVGTAQRNAHAFMAEVVELLKGPSVSTAEVA